MMKILLIFVILILADNFGFINRNENIASDYASAKLLQSEINTEFIMLTEQFKPVKGYEGIYEVSNLGRVKSLKRTVKNTGSYSGFLLVKEKIRKNYLHIGGYYMVNLSKNGKTRLRPVHLIVWDALGDKPRNGRKLQVDHIDNNKLNNRLDNLQLLTHRENIIKYQSLQKTRTSKYIGVTMKKGRKKWVTHIVINHKKEYLGSFVFEKEAGLAYQKARLKYGV